MKDKQGYIDLTTIDISIKDFDAFSETHKFSKEYKENKKKMLREYKRNLVQPAKRNIFKIAAAAVILFTLAPVIANAASKGEFFNRIWGKLGKKDIEAHDEVVYDTEKGTSCVVTYPKQEFEDINVDKAEQLIGSSVSYEAIVRELGDTKLTILAAVSDGNAAVVEFMLEKKGGIDVLNYGQFDNETKGAWFSESSDFYIQMKDSSEKIYVDLEKSTSDILYCYDYAVLDIFSSDIKELIMETYQYSMPQNKLFEMDDEEIANNTLMEEISIPVHKLLENIELTNMDDGKINISPISMKIDMNKGLELTEEDAYDPYNIYYVAINYKDGSNYIVHEHEIEGIYSCDAELDNASYTCSNTENKITFVFNRLVDINNIESITVNKTQYF